MYVRRVKLSNIRSIRELDWGIGLRGAAGWHVVIGDNGSGKSTFLRAIALALVGPSDAIALRQDWNDWLSRDQSQGSITLWLSSHFILDKFAGRGRPPDSLPGFVLKLARQNGDVDLKGPRLQGKNNPEKHVWSGKAGWFSVAYGPFRRFTGGDRDYEKIFYSNPRLAAHLSVFGENVALTECLEWLVQLNYKKLEGRHEGALLDRVKAFINQEGFLPHQARLHEISSDGVEFVDGNGCQLPVEELSDGYRSILSMTFELIRQLTVTYETWNIFDPKDPTKIISPGVVLIDEVDAHLHPTWQRKIGPWFREHFPMLQFIVSTHSPFICQAADVGTVFRLPKPGSDEPARMIAGAELNRLLFGNVLDAYSTEMFGQDVSRSDESKQKLQRLAELNKKELGDGLTEAEKKEQEELRATLPTSAHKIA